MTNGENYDGAEESIKQLIKLGKVAYKAFRGPQIPKDPREVIALEKKVREEEHLRLKAERSKDNIKKIWKDRDREARLKRRAKLKRILTLGKKK